jgi:hypothetical protein
MNTDNSNDRLGVASNLGVILDLVSLAPGNNQSTKATAVAASDSVTNGYIEISRYVIANTQFGRVFAPGLYRHKRLTEAEAVQFAT